VHTHMHQAEISSVCEHQRPSCKSQLLFPRWFFRTVGVLYRPLQSRPRSSNS